MQGRFSEDCLHILSFSPFPVRLEHQPPLDGLGKYQYKKPTCLVSNSTSCHRACVHCTPNRLKVKEFFSFFLCSRFSEDYLHILPFFVYDGTPIIDGKFEEVSSQETTWFQTAWVVIEHMFTLLVFNSKSKENLLIKNRAN